jgi:uncharacterized lipoprotein YehR (DUF1307 family)
MTNPTDEKLDTLDWTDSNAVFAFGVGTVEVAREYQKARKTFAISLKTLKMKLAKAYANREVEVRTAEDKAYLVLANNSEEAREALQNMIESEQDYKGLEKVLDTRQAVASLAQSLIKNKIENT